MLVSARDCARSGNDRHVLGNALNELGVIHRDLGSYQEALPLFQQALAIFQGEDQAQPQSVVAALNNIGTVDQALGDYEHAEELYRKSIDAFRKQGDKNGLKRSLANLASLASLRGDYARAQRLLEEASANAGDPDTADAALVLNQLGVLFQKLGRSDAEAILRRALAATERQLGPTHMETIFVTNNLAYTLADQGRFAEAQLLTRRAYDACTEVAGHSVKCANILNNLASIEQKTGREADAEAHWRECIALFTGQPAADAIALIAALNNLGKAYYDRKQLRDAQPLFERALASGVKMRGVPNPDYACLLTNMGAVMIEQRHFDKAASYFDRARAIDEKAFGPVHARVAVDWNNLAVLAARQKRYDEAIADFRKSIEIYEKMSGPSSPKIASAFANLAEINYLRRRYKDAADQFGRAFAIWGQQTGLPAGSELAILEQFATCLRQTESFAEAEQVATRAMNLRVKLALSKTARRDL